LADSLDDPALFAEFTSASEKIADHFEAREYSKAMRKIMALADKANQYIEQKKPWAIAKNEPHSPNIQAICTHGLNMFRILMIYLTPVIPAVAKQAQKLFNEKSWNWKAAGKPLLNHTISEYEPLLTRIDSKQVEHMIEQSK
jgi:methionyl-tRNA synthetase